MSDRERQCVHHSCVFQTRDRKMDICALDIVRESSGMLCSSLPMLLLITLVLIFPVSSIVLSQVMSNSHLAAQLSAHLARHLAHAGIRLSSFTTLFYMQLSQTLVSHAMCFPVILTLLILAKTAIFYILACRQRGIEASVMGFLVEGPRAWSRIAATYVSGCVLVILMTGMVVLFKVAGAFLFQVTNSMRIDGYDIWVYMVLEIGIAVVYALVLAPLVIVLNLGSVVAGMEERRCGGRALLQALTLLKRRKLQPALLLFLVTGIGIAIVECAFQYRVLGRGSEGASSLSLVEAPFLIFAHSFLVLFGTLMSFAFYNACANALTYSYHMGKQEGDEEEDDHLSIAVHIVEQQCRKLMYPSINTLL